MDGIGEVDTHYRLLTMGPFVVLVVARVAVARRPIQGYKQYQSYSLDIVVIANGLPAKYGLHFCGKGRRIDRRYYKTRMRTPTMDSNATLYKVIPRHRQILNAVYSSPQNSMGSKLTGSVVQGRALKTAKGTARTNMYRSSPH